MHHSSETLALISKCEKEKPLSFDEVKTLYKDERIKELRFSSGEKGYSVTKLSLKDGRSILFR